MCWGNVHLIRAVAPLRPNHIRFRQGSSRAGEVLGCESGVRYRPSPRKRGSDQMLYSAKRNATRAGQTAGAVCLAAVLLLAACGKSASSESADSAAEQPPVATTPATPTVSASRPSNQAPPVGSVQATSQVDTSGWVLAPPFYAAGDEPFWKLDIIDGWFVFRRSGLAEIEAPIVQPTQAGGADVFDTPPLKVTIRRRACETEQGGRGDISAQVMFDEVEYDGCAFGGSAGASAEASAVLDALASIDACLAKLEEPALVTATYPREEGRTAVALRTKVGSLYECGVEPDKQTIAFLDPIEQRAAGAWMSRMRFLRAGVADGTKCEGAEEVRSGDTVVGRLLSKACRF